MLDQTIDPWHPNAVSGFDEHAHRAETVYKSVYLKNSGQERIVFHLDSSCVHRAKFNCITPKATRATYANLTTRLVSEIEVHFQFKIPIPCVLNLVFFFDAMWPRMLLFAGGRGSCARYDHHFATRRGEGFPQAGKLPIARSARAESCIDQPFPSRGMSLCCTPVTMATRPNTQGPTRDGTSVHFVLHYY